MHDQDSQRTLDRSAASIREQVESIKDRLQDRVGANRFSVSDIYQSSVKGFTINIPDNDPLDTRSA